MRIARLCSLLLLSGFAFAAQAKMVQKPVEWTQDGTTFHSVLVYDDAVTAKRPGLVMVPNWYGVNDGAIKKAEGIAGKDYVILVTDMYGEKTLYEGGLSVRTSLDPGLQVIARQALIDGLIKFDVAHGWRGPVAHLATAAAADKPPQM